MRFENCRIIVAAAVTAFGMIGFATAQTAEMTVDLYRISDTGVHERMGAVTLIESVKGVTLKVNATGISSGPHGFHVHENPSCSPGSKDGRSQAGVSAGEHYDPGKTAKHAGPSGRGHVGDLPRLVSVRNTIKSVVNVPGLKLVDILGRALIIHEGGDTYSDKPAAGGGRGRIACAIIPAAI